VTVATLPARRLPDLDQRCTAVASSTGSRCRHWTSHGTDRCASHALTAITLPAQSVTASVASVEMDGVGWRTWRPGSRTWQAEAWRLYDITPQLRFVCNWIGNSVSRCRLYVAELDESGEVTGETEDPDIAVLAQGPLGKGPAKDEALRLLAINLYVPGDGYVVAEADAAPDGDDLWYVVSGRQIRLSGDRIIIRRSLLHGGGDMVFRPGIDLLLQVWTPHPADPDEPDSPTRSAIPDLREIEALRKREFAELDSRLAGAGLLALPQGIDFPRGPDDPPGVDGFQRVLMRAMATSLRDRASAEALVPILMTVPPDAVDKIKLITFWSDLSEQLLPLREAAVRSLAQGLDIPPEILLGQADSNHWCVDDQTEILTVDGWRTHDQLAPGDVVMTLNHDTGISEWQPVDDVRRWQVAGLDMVAMKAPGHSSLTTPNHRWPVLTDGQRRFVTTEQLGPNDRMVVGAWNPGMADQPHLDAAPVLYSGTIWCPVTPNQTWLARHDGTVFYTGNTAWQVSEDAITTQIKPILSRIADALTTGYLRPALESMGLDPDLYSYDFDTAPLSARPNRSTDALAYHEELLLSDEAAVVAGAFVPEQMPTQRERLRRLAEKALMADPTLLTDPTIRTLIGLPAPAPSVTAPTAPPGVGGPTQQPAQPGEPQPGQPRAIPAQPTEAPQPAPTPTQPAPQPAPSTASLLLPVAGLAVRRALGLAGVRLITHHQRDQWPDTPRYQLHTRRGPVSPGDAERVLRGAWIDLAPAAEDLGLDPGQVEALLHGFCLELLTRGLGYDPALLRDLVDAACTGRRLNAPDLVAA